MIMLDRCESVANPDTLQTDNCICGYINAKQIPAISSYVILLLWDRLCYSPTGISDHIQPLHPLKSELGMPRYALCTPTSALCMPTPATCTTTISNMHSHTSNVHDHHYHCARPHQHLTPTSAPRTPTPEPCTLTSATCTTTISTAHSHTST